MKKTLTAVALCLAAISGAAQAADLPSRKAAPIYVPPPPPPLWTGLYVGVNLGGGWSANSGDSTLAYADPGFPILSLPDGVTPNLFGLPGGGTAGNNSGGVVGGGQIGFNYQLGQSFVIGGEADIQGTSITGGNQGNWAGLYPSPFAAIAGSPGVLAPLATGNGGNLGLPWFGTVRGRLGFLITPTLLIYGTGGFAYGEVTAFNFSNTRTGWTAGGGVEWMFLPNWSAKAEYLFTDLDSGGSTGGGGWNYGYHRHPQINVVRAGVNYHFNWGAPAPVVAKY